MMRARARKRVHAHPAFPNLPEDTPLTYVLMVAACLDAAIAERPTFAQAEQVLLDIDGEVASGSYLDARGLPRVRRPPSPLSLPACRSVSPFVLKYVR